MRNVVISCRKNHSEECGKGISCCQERAETVVPGFGCLRLLKLLLTCLLGWLKHSFWCLNALIKASLSFFGKHFHFCLFQSLFLGKINYCLWTCIGLISCCWMTCLTDMTLGDEMVYLVQGFSGFSP